eukprot:11912540-Alexandrium_andersonii.AAC.1
MHMRWPGCTCGYPQPSRVFPVALVTNNRSRRDRDPAVDSASEWPPAIRAIQLRAESRDPAS